MKKMLLFVCVFSLLSAQDQKVITTQSPQEKELNKAFDYLKKARGCLSGIGCSKNQSYFANYTLGVAVRLAAIAVEESRLNYKTKIADVSDILKIAYDMGYRYFVFDSVHLWRCLMFRGCDDQTKRYLFYYLGLWSGQFGYLGYTASLNKMFQEHQGSDRENIEYRDFDRRFITIHDRDVKRELNLSPTQSEFFWYELLGFSTVPTQREAEKKFRQMFRIYHPDITTKNYLLAEKVMKVISEAKIIAHTEINLNEDLSVPQLLQ